MNSLFSLSFWFSRVPPPFTPTSEKILFALWIVFLLAGLAVRLWSNRREYDRYLGTIFSRVGRLLVTMGILGLIWFFLSFQQIPLLGSRFWFLLWAIGVVGWATMILVFVYRRVPELRRLDIERQERDKYFPPRKKKNKK